MIEEYEKKHNQLIRNAGGEFTVLLRKDGNFPLDKPGKIALYGSGVRHTVKGGTGSGEVNSRFFVNVEEGIRDAGFEITTKAWLDSYDKVRSAAKADFRREVKREARRKRVLSMRICFGRYPHEPEYDIPLDGEGDTAVYVLSRISGEGADRNPVAGDILLTETETRDILACNEKYKNFMLVINTGGVVDLKDVKDVKNILILSQLGVETGNILADILLGRSNPSGRLTATWTSWEDYPAMVDFGGIDDTRYKEGIFTGYRYFDTEGKDVLFPFGYGLSYTEFDTVFEDITTDKELIRVSTEVTNTGSLKGRETVLLYVSKPQGKLTQARHELIAFAKTSVLEPGQTETVELEFKARYMDSYDEEKESYFLEAGDYLISLGKGKGGFVPSAIVRVAERIVTARVKNVFGKVDFEDYDPQDKALSAFEDTEGLKTVVLGKSDISTIYPYAEPEADGIADEYLAQATALASDMSNEELILMNIGAFDPHAGIIGMVGNSGFSVPGAAGQTYAGKDGSIPVLVMADGPAGLRLNRVYARDKKGRPHGLGYSIPETMTPFMPKIGEFLLALRSYKIRPSDVIKNQYATAIPIGTAIAQSFDVGLAESLGDIVGYEMERFGIALWLAPALNIQRSIRCGRNFEYFSEDPVISGLFAGAICRGVQKHKGCGAVIKHFAANNQETGRIHSNSIASERTFREIYLKGFAIAVAAGNPVATMTSYNLMNGVHSGEHLDLIEGVLRKEFRFDGIVMTDWLIDGNKREKGSIHPISNAPEVIMSGSNLFMPGHKNDVRKVKKALAAGQVTREQLESNAAGTIALALKFDAEKKREV